MFTSPERNPRWAELKGAAIIFVPLSFNANTPRKHDLGTAAALVADVYVVDGPKAGTRYLKTTIFSQGIIKSLKNHIGSMVLARLAQQEMPDPRLQPMWVLIDATHEGETVAKAASLMVKTGVIGG